jgi:hypothetical protein
MKRPKFIGKRIENYQKIKPGRYVSKDKDTGYYWIFDIIKMPKGNYEAIWAEYFPEMGLKNALNHLKKSNKIRLETHVIGDLLPISTFKDVKEEYSNNEVYYEYKTLSKVLEEL